MGGDGAHARREGPQPLRHSPDAAGRRSAASESPRLGLTNDRGKTTLHKRHMLGQCTCFYVDTQDLTAYGRQKLIGLSSHQPRLANTTTGRMGGGGGGCCKDAYLPQGQLQCSPWCSPVLSERLT